MNVGHIVEGNYYGLRWHVHTSFQVEEWASETGIEKRIISKLNYCLIDLYNREEMLLLVDA